MKVVLSSGELFKLLGYSSSSGDLFDSPVSATYFVSAMTLEERLKLAREIAARTKPRFVIDNSRREAKQMRFEEAQGANHGPRQAEAQVAALISRRGNSAR
jgi:hypothetical protein